MFPTTHPPWGAEAASPVWPSPLCSEEGKGLKAGCAEGRAEQGDRREDACEGAARSRRLVFEGSGNKAIGAPGAEVLSTELPVHSYMSSISTAHSLGSRYGSVKVRKVAERLGLGAHHCCRVSWERQPDLHRLTKTHPLGQPGGGVCLKQCSCHRMWDQGHRMCLGGHSEVNPYLACALGEAKYFL